MKSLFRARLTRFSTFCFSLLGWLAAGYSEPPPPALPRTVFEFRDGDRVALVGDTLIEREPAYGFIEHRLTVQFPARSVVFRNLGWSADTPAGESRASFDHDKPGKGFERLKEQIAAVNPTVVIVGYGMASSFAGEGGLVKFKTDLNKLIDTIQELSTNKPMRFILLGPISHENLGGPLPDPTTHNEQLRLYTKAIRSIAVERDAIPATSSLGAKTNPSARGTVSQQNVRFANLFDLMGDPNIVGQTRPPQPLTDNGIHLSAFGYLRAAEAIEKHLYWEQNLWRIGITADGKVTDGTYGTKVSDLDKSADHVRLTSLDNQLVNPILRENGKRIPSVTSPCMIQVGGLKRGCYELTCDGQVVATGTDAEWSRGVVLERGPQFDQAEELHQTILKKNELYFNRWRPQNETYLFGFRKHEQGKNAAEVTKFDPLVAEQDAKIAKLSQPVKHTYKLIPSAKTPPSIAERETWKVEQSQRLHLSAATEFEIASGFEVSLFAESPLLAKPIQMNFDPRGRLWIASSSVYPQIEPGQTANDRILILEDTDGDGKADKSTVFADGLLIPTGIEPGDGGAYVGQSTELLHFKDTNGDGKADEKRIVLSGFGTEDTHHIIHTLRWGHDGQLYFNQSIYIHSHVETPHGVVRLNSGGILHLRPPTMELGVLLRGLVNSWGHHFDDFGQSFVTDGAGSGGINYGLPGAMFMTYEGARRTLGSVSPGSYPKFCGLEIIGSDHFPKDWQGNAITCDFRAHRVVRFAIEEKDSAYVTKEMPDLIRSTNITFRPVDVKIGPDGALYIADWSNPIIQHGEVDFRDPRRDHEQGRIWRVTAKGRPLMKKPALVNASNKELLNQLLSPNEFNRQQSRRVLTERGQKILPDLAKWTKAQSTEKAWLEALWMYQSIDVVQSELLEKLLSAKDGRVRAAATRVASFWHPRLKNPVDLLAQQITDEHPRVRLEAMRALAKIPTARSAELVLSALDKPMDSFLDYALWLSINDFARPWVAAIKSGQWNADGREKQLEFGLKAIEPALAKEALGKILESKTISRDGSGPWIELIGLAGGEKELRRIFEQAFQNNFDDPAKLRVLKALGEAARLREAKPSGALDSVSGLFDSADGKIREEAFRLAGTWKLQKVAPRLLTVAGDNTARPALREVAFASLREIGGNDVVAGLERLSKTEKDASIRRAAVLALAALEFDKAKQPAIDALSEAADEKDVLELWRSLLKLKGAATNLAHALPKTGLPSVMARAGLRVAREGGRNEPDLVWALIRGANLEGESQSLSAEEIQQLAASVAKEGDAARGEKIYRRKDLACTICHAIGGVGGKAGPDMTSLGASAQVDYLIESVLYPNRKIKEGFHSIVIETTDGEDRSGILVSDNTEQLVVRDAANQEVSIPKNKIKSRAVGNSLMPMGLVDGLTPGERLDLFRFLSELGKPGPYDASKGNVARSWRLLPATIDIAQFGDEKALSGNITDTNWSAASSLVDGRLLQGELQSALEEAKRREPKAIYAATQVQIAKAGTIRFQLSGAAGSPVWIDGKPANTSGEMSADLPAGTHTVTVKLGAQKLPDYIRLESPDGTFLTN